MTFFLVQEESLKECNHKCPFQQIILCNPTLLNHCLHGYISQSHHVFYFHHLCHKHPPSPTPPDTLFKSLSKTILPWTDDSIKILLPAGPPVKPAPLTALSLKAESISCRAPGEAPLNTRPLKTSSHSIHLVVHATIPVIIRNSAAPAPSSSPSTGWWRAFSWRSVGSETGIAICSSLPSSGLLFAHLHQSFPQNLTKSSNITCIRFKGNWHFSTKSVPNWAKSSGGLTFLSNKASISSLPYR